MVNNYTHTHRKYCVCFVLFTSTPYNLQTSLSVLYSCDVPYPLAVLGGERGKKKRHKALPSGQCLKNCFVFTTGTINAFQFKDVLEGLKIPFGSSSFSADLPEQLRVTPAYSHWLFERMLFLM